MNYLKQKKFKITGCVILTVLSLTMLQNKDTAAEPKTKNAYVTTSLRMRTEPNLKGKIIKVLKSGTEITIIETQQEIIKIGNKEGHWAKIMLNNKEGWVFDPFLRDTKPEKYIAPGTIPKTVRGYYYGEYSDNKSYIDPFNGGVIVINKNSVSYYFGGGGEGADDIEYNVVCMLGSVKKSGKSVTLNCNATCPPNNMKKNHIYKCDISKITITPGKGKNKTFEIEMKSNAENPGKTILPLIKSS